MNSRIAIRRPKPRDAPAIAHLSKTLGYDAVTAVMRRRLRAILASASDLIVVAVGGNGAVVGWLQAHAAHIVESGFRVEITGLVVSPEFRRRGAGSSLVAAAERWAKSMSAEAIVVRSNVKRVESHAFYPALGYSPNKTQIVYRKAFVSPY